LFEKILKDLNEVKEHLNKDWNIPERSTLRYEKTTRNIDLYVGDRVCRCCSGKIFCNKPT